METQSNHISLSFVKTFAYDYCFWSMDESETEKFAGQFLHFLMKPPCLFLGSVTNISSVSSCYDGSCAAGASEDKVLFTHQDHLY